MVGELFGAQTNGHPSPGRRRHDSGKSLPAMAMQQCPAEHLKNDLKDLLQDFTNNNWSQELPLKLNGVLRRQWVTAVSHCKCLQCRKSRRIALGSPDVNGDVLLQLDGIERSKRLLALCIYIEDPFLVCTILNNGFNDETFRACRSEKVLTDAGIPSLNAKLLLKDKKWFFPVGIARYLRSSTASKDADAPGDLERGWLMGEFLLLLQKLAVPPNHPQAARLRNSSIGDLEFSKNHAMVIDRSNDEFTELWDEKISPQSTGWLLLDFICFFKGGPAKVKKLDATVESRNSQTIRQAVPRIFNPVDSTFQLSRAFDLVRILVSQNPEAPEFGLGNVNNYAYCRGHLSRIWPVIDPSLNPTNRDRSDDGDRSPDSMSLATNNPTNRYPGEVKGPYFRWLFLGYREHSEEGGPFRPCRVQFIRIKSDTDDRLHVHLFPFVEDLYKMVKKSASLKSHGGLVLVPLDALDCGEMEFKLQFKNDAVGNLTIPWTFKLPTRDDVAKCQQALTGRTVELDKRLHEFSVSYEERRHKIRFPRWGPRRELEQHGASRLQLWRVVDHEILEEIHSDDDGDQDHAGEVEDLLLEIALYARGTLLVIGIKSLLLLDIDESKDPLQLILKLENGEGFEGRLSKNEYDVEDATKYPGLTLFQEPPFKNYADGVEVRCHAVTLRFKTRQERVQVEQFLRKHYDATY